jgi:hypothetical protein
MATDLAALPPGFELEAAPATSGLPQGFELESQSKPISVSGTAKAIGTGLEQGVAAMVGLPGDAQKGMNWLFDKTMPSTNTVRGLFGKAPLSQDELNKSRAESGLGTSYLPTTSGIMSGLDSLGLVHQPENALEQHAQNVAAFVPAAVGGPESIAANVIKRGIVPGVTSDALGTATEGTALEPWARMAGGLVQIGPKNINTTPTSEQLIEQGGKQFQQLRDSNVEYHPMGTQQVAADAQDVLSRKGLDKDFAPLTDAALEKLGNINRPVTGLDMDKARGLLRDAQNTGGKEGAAATIALQHLDDFVHNPPYVLQGDATNFMNTWDAAKSNYSRGMTAQNIENVAQQATNRSAAQNSGLNSGNQVRGAMARVLNGDTAGLRADEVAQLQRIVDGSRTMNYIREAANRLGGGGGVAGTIIAGLGGTAGYDTTGSGLGATAGAVGALLGARGLRGIYNRGIANQAANLSQQIRSKAPMSIAQGTPAISGLSPQITRLLNLSRILGANGS